ncbi:MAG: hypothetical protein MK008_08220 [Bdellovibrionales bacterium]|nr:hypothetical protein [Bdellovibrionales bacterium]
MKLFVVLMAISMPFTSWAQSLSKSQADISSKSKLNPYALYYKRTFTQTGNVPSNKIVPEDLDVDVLAFGAEYNFTPKHSIRLTGSYVENHVIIKAPFFNVDAKTKGLSDTRLDYLYGLNKNIKVGLGVSAPTGSIDERYDGRLISYPGQLGSGTYDFIPQVEAKYTFGDFSLRPRLWATIRTGRNDQNYRLGDEFRAVVNGRYSINKYLAVTANLHYKDWGAVVGSQLRTSGSSAQRKNSGQRGGGGRPPAFVRQQMQQGEVSSPHSRPQVGEHNATQAQGRPPSSDKGGPPSNNPFAGFDLSDPFEAAGTRWGANMGLATGLYLGGGYIFAIEAGTPVYYDQDSELEGLEVDWYATGFITKRF